MKKTLITTGLAVAIAAAPALAGWEEGVAAFKAGNYAEAATQFEELVQSRDDCAVCYQMYGQSLLKLGRAQEAAQQLRKAYDMKPDDNAIRLPLAQAYVQAQRYDDAVGLLNTIDVDALDDARKTAVYQLRAIALDKSGRSDEMVDDLRRAAQTDSGNAQAQYRYGAACLSNQDTACAVPALRNAVRLDPSNANMKASLTKALMLQGRQSGRNASAKSAAYREAVQVANQLVSADSSFDNLLLLGEAQLGAKSYSDAVGTFERATRANQGSWLAAYYLGQAQTSTDAFERAEENLKSALAKTNSAKDQTLIWRQLGFVYEKQKSYDAAIAAYRKVGDANGEARVVENKRIADENAQIDQFNDQVQQLEAERQKLKEEMENLPPD